MNQILYFVLGIAIGSIAIWLLLRSRSQNRLDFISKEKQKMAENLQKIKDFMVSKDKVTNNDVAKLLNVSDATVVRYMDELEKQGFLKQVGKTGKYVFYSKV